MKIKTREELEKLSLEEIKAYNKELAEFKEKQTLIADAEKASIEIPKADPKNDLANIAEQAQKGNRDPELVKALTKVTAELEQMKKQASPSFGGLTVNDSVKKQFGSEGDEIVAMAKDIAVALPLLDAVAKSCGKKVTELKAYKNQFGMSEENLKKVVDCIEKQNGELGRDLRTKTALDSAADSSWIPTGFETSVISIILKAKAVGANIPSFDAPTANFDWPTQSGNPTVYSDGESLTGGEVTLSGSKPTSSKTTWAAAKLACRVDFSDEMNEDVAFALIPSLQFQMGDAIGDGFERVCLFGDTQATTTNINKYGASVTTTAGAADLYLATNGLVKKALASNGSTKDCSAAASPSEAVRLTMASMGEGAKDTGMLRLFVPPAFYFAMLDDPSIKNVFNYGQGASILTGEVGRVFGIPVLMSSGIPLSDVNGRVDGVTAGNNVLSSFVLANSSKIMVAYRRRLKLASNFFVITDNYRLVASMRFDIQQFGSNISGRNPIGYGYNYAV